MDYEDKWFQLLGDTIDSVPSIYYLWQKAQPFVKKNDKRNISRYQNLIMVLHNSVVSPYCKLGKDVKFGYGGIGVVIHKDATVKDGVAIGQNVTIGGAAGRYRLGKDGKRYFIPLINNDVYIAAGCQIVGGIELGAFAVIGANSVVTTNTDPFSVYAGVPARKLIDLNKKNALKYKSYFHRFKSLNNEDFLMNFPD